MEHKSPRDSELVADGWTRQFSASSPRLEEAVENYTDMGFEVILEQVDVCADNGSCTACIAENPEFVKVIYTRPIND